MQQCPAVAHTTLVITRVPKQFVVGGQNPGERQEGGEGGDAYRERQIRVTKGEERRMMWMLFFLSA